MTSAEEKLLELENLIRLIVNERISDLGLREDAQQEAMLRAWERLRDGHSHGIAIHAAKQAAIDVARGGRMTGSKASGKAITRTVPLTRDSEGGEEYVLEPADPGAERAYDAIAQEAALASLLGPLSDDQRSVVLLWLGGRTTSEIAGIVGITRQGVDHRLNRALTILRRALQP